MALASSKHHRDVLALVATDAAPRIVLWSVLVPAAR
jgi:hypothetical protein